VDGIEAVLHDPPPSVPTIAPGMENVETVTSRFWRPADRICSSFDSISFSKNESESKKSARTTS
jgi:hypothetical protein